MDFKQRYDFCQRTAEYVGMVVVHLSTYVGEQSAPERVLTQLALVLENMFDRTPPEDMAWSLIPQPHNIPMPPSTT